MANTSSGLPDADDMMAAAFVLFHVIDAATDALCEMDFGPTGNRNRELERVDGLVQAAWQLAKNLVQPEV